MRKVIFPKYLKERYDSRKHIGLSRRSHVFLMQFSSCETISRDIFLSNKYYPSLKGILFVGRKIVLHLIYIKFSTFYIKTSDTE